MEPSPPLLSHTRRSLPLLLVACFMTTSAILAEEVDWESLRERAAKGESPDETGFEETLALLWSELDAVRPVVVDLKYIGPQYAGGIAGHTLCVCGSLAAEDLKDFWRSNSYGTQANAVLSRPAFVIEAR